MIILKFHDVFCLYWIAIEVLQAGSPNVSCILNDQCRAAFACFSITKHRWHWQLFVVGHGDKWAFPIPLKFCTHTKRNCNTLCKLNTMKNVENTATLDTHKIDSKCVSSNAVHLVSFSWLAAADGKWSYRDVYLFLFHFNSMQLMLYFFLNSWGEMCKSKRKEPMAKQHRHWDSYFAIILLLNSIHLKRT